MRYIKYITAISAFALLFSTPLHAAETYTMDPQHSYVAWHISHFDFSKPTGKWMANGTIVLDEQNLQNSQVNATIKVADIITGLSELDKHLKGKLFFDVEKFPTATFVSDKIDIVDKKIDKVHGALTVHGVTKPVTLNVKLNKMGINPITENPTIGFSGNTTLKRSDFGMKTMLPGVGDEVNIEIQVEAYKPK